MILKQTIEFEVYPNDIAGEYTWDEAVEACKKLGDGWRLPTQEELHLMWANKENIGNFLVHYYWNSSEYNANIAWRQGFGNGYHDCGYKNYPSRFRPVRDVKQEEGDSLYRLWKFCPQCGAKLNWEEK